MNELVRVEHGPSADVTAYRASTEAASLCKEIVVATSSNIQGKRYVSVEGWQALATAHGCALSASNVERVEGGVRAVGEVHRMSDGQIIATGEGFVGEDEPTWFGGQSKGKTLPKRADYAIRAMAQTRAMSRAGRSAFAHVVVMMNAGLATTPAEEMVTYDGETGEIIDTPAREKVPGIHKIKERLSKLLTEGNAATDMATLDALIKSHKDDLKTIRDSNHEWWTGDGEDFEGFAAWKDRRKAELSVSTEYQFLSSIVDGCKSYEELRSAFDEYEGKIEALDDAERRRFDSLYNDKEASFDAKAPTPLTAGAYGG